MDELIRAMETIGRSVPVFRNPRHIDDAVARLRLSMVERDRGNTAWLEDIPEGYGILCIEARIDGLDNHNNARLRKFAGKWNDLKTREARTLGYHRSRCYTGRIDKLSFVEQTDWIPMVISQAKNLQERVRDHVFTPGNDQTWGLRLGNSNDAVAQITGIRVGVLPVAITEDAYHAIDLLKVALIQRLHPIAGK
jgi:hypothetical protein